ncbi:glutamate synthase [Actinoplanes capillaceus]|uniref:Glutamate synthase n=1 Tax=Actinoplanes campanulatus TaxID=113559 RepID=A0ABQ3WUM9_9ACTN|nr:glutamate synthase-related protein [Actinoplanes capillaceus]GID50002.1 glutamate synthase [Actinoplanes capillaceus]
MTSLAAPGFDEARVRERARLGAGAVFPHPGGYGNTVFGQDPTAAAGDEIDELRLVPPVFVPGRLTRLFELGEEPMPGDVLLDTAVGGFASPYPLYVSAFGSTDVSASGLSAALSRQAGVLGIPMVIGENLVPTAGLGRLGERTRGALLGRIEAYLSGAGAHGGVVVQQSTQDADAEVWNVVYSDPTATALLDQGRLAFELKVGQGAKPGLGGQTLLRREQAAGLADRFTLAELYEPGTDAVLRCATPGTFTEEILAQQIRLMRNNYPRCRIWVKLPPGRDVSRATEICWGAGADAVTVDGAEGGTGWAPAAFLQHVGLPLAECLARVDPRGRDLLVSGRILDGARAAKCLALGARAVGLGRAALVAVDEDPRHGLVRLIEAMALELRLIASALGKYDIADLDRDDLWSPRTRGTPAGLARQYEGASPSMENMEAGR